MKSRFSIVLLFFLLTGFPVLGADTAAAQMGALEGYVYDAVTNNPIPEAWIDAFVGDEWYYTDSLADGSYHLDSAAGTNELEVWAPGYEILVVSIEITEGVTVPRDFYLQPLDLESIGLVQGTVEDCETNQPIRNARIEVDTGEYTYTDGAGGYALELPYDIYFIIFDASGYAEIWDLILVDTPSVDLGQICLYKEDRLGHVYGTIRDSQTGSPVADAFLSLSDYPFYTSSDYDGYYWMQVPPRPVELVVEAEGYVTKTADVSLSAGEGDQLNVDLDPVGMGFDDHCNVADTCATALYVNGEPVDGSFETAGDVDWFRFQGTSGIIYEIETSELGPGSDTFIYLYREDGTTLIDSDDDDGVGLASKIAWTSDQDGLFYIKVNHYSSSGTGTYQITVKGSDDHCNQLGPCATELLTDGSPVPGYIEEGEDRDWFRFEALPALTYKIETFDLGPRSDTVIELYDGSGNPLDSDDDGGEGLASRINWVANGQGTFYVMVSHFSQAGTGSYYIRVTAFDDHCNTATYCATYLIPNDNPTQGSFEIDGDEDWFRFHAAAGVNYVIETSDLSVDPSSDTFISLYSSDGQGIASDDDGGVGLASRISWNASTAGTYYVRVKHYSSHGRGTYNITITAPWATLLQTDGAPASGSLDNENDWDFYLFNAEEGRAYTIETSNLSLSCDTYIFLWEPDGSTVIAEDDDGGEGLASRISFVADVSGPHYVGVRPYDASGVGTYEITVSEQDDHADAPGTEATLVQVNGSRTTGVFEEEGDEDWFRFDAVAGERYVIETGELEDNCDTYMEVYDSDGLTVLAWDDDGGDGLASQIAWTAPSSSTFYVRLIHFNPYGTGSYQIWVRTQAVVNDDHGGDSSNATQVNTDGSSVSGQINFPRDVDWFQFQVTETNVGYLIETSMLDEQCDTIIEIYGSDGVTRITVDDDSGAGLGSLIAWTAGGPGTYYVVVRHYDDEGTGVYGLSIQQVSLACTSITANQLVSGTISEEGGSDLYCLDVNEGDLVEVTLNGPQDSDFDLYLQSGFPPILSYFEVRGFTVTSQETCELTASDSGTLYIRVKSYAGFGDYSLQADVTPYSVPSCIALTEGEAQTGTLNGAGDGRFYCLDVDEEDQILITLDGPDSGEDFDVYLKFGSAPTPSDYDARGYSPFADEVAAMSAQGAGTIYVWVVSYSGDGEYSLEAQITRTGPECTKLTEGEVWEDTDWLYVTYDEQLYCFDMNAGERITVTLNGPQNDEDFDLFLKFGSADVLDNPDVESISFDSDEQVQFTAPSDGPVYVLVFSYSGSGEYTVQATILTNPQASGFITKLSQTPGQVLYFRGSIVDKPMDNKITPNRFCITIKDDDVGKRCYDADPNVTSQISFLPGGYFFFTSEKVINTYTCTITDIPCYGDAQKDFSMEQINNLLFEVEVDAATDCDTDGMATGWEKRHSLNIWKNDANLDLDQDGYANIEEYNAGSNPNDKNSIPWLKAEGNINGDGRVDLADAIIALQVIAGMDVSGLIVANYATSGADVNGDGRIGMEEIIYILQYTAQLRP